MTVSNFTIFQQVTRSCWSSLRSVFIKGLQKVDLFYPLRYCLSRIPIQDQKFAHFLCHLIPNQCPFARDIELFSRFVIHIPPLCKLNPLYQELMELRFRAICYLVDQCGEEISQYC